MSEPCLVISGSRVPSESTRLRMMSTDTSSESCENLPTGERTTEVPPWRSRPSTGDLSEVTRVDERADHHHQGDDQEDRRCGGRSLVHLAVVDGSASPGR